MQNMSTARKKSNLRCTLPQRGQDFTREKKDTKDESTVPQKNRPRPHLPCSLKVLVEWTFRGPNSPRRMPQHKSLHQLFRKGFPQPVHHFTCCSRKLHAGVKVVSEDAKKKCFLTSLGRPFQNKKRGGRDTEHKSEICWQEKECSGNHLQRIAPNKLVSQIKQRTQHTWKLC